MTNEKQSAEEYHLHSAAELMSQAASHVSSAMSSLKLPPLKPPYRTPQWHHTVLWAGFMFITGLLTGACLMSL